MQEPICPACASPLEPDPPPGAPYITVDGSGIAPDPGREVGFRARYCPLNHAVHLELVWQEARILLSPSDYMAELARKARQMGLKVPEPDEFVKKFSMGPDGGRGTKDEG